jgi:hypothetical protein
MGESLLLNRYRCNRFDLKLEIGILRYTFNYIFFFRNSLVEEGHCLDKLGRVL